MKKRDLVVIGGGAGGLVVASVAAQLGLHVTLIEREPQLGGDCLHSGCVPSKSLLHVARLRHLAKDAQQLGLVDALSPLDMTAVNGYIQSVIAKIQVHDDPQRFRDYGCEVLFGEAAFTDPHTVEVNGEAVRGRRFVLATGSKPLVPAIPGLAETPYLTNETIFSQPTLPRHLAILGGGPIGVEMGQAFARLGSRVSLIEQQDRLLPHDDSELADMLRQSLSAEGVEIHLSTRAEAVSTVDGGIEISTGESQRLAADALLVAVGRQADSASLNLDAAGVKYDRRGIKVDARLRTSSQHIYACGDVCGPWQFTHMAEYQAGIVISNAVFRFPKKVDYRVVPRVTYSDPELAQVGLTEAEARAQGLKFETLRFPVGDIDRALIEGHSTGLSKLLVSKGRVVGASILAPHAGELIHEIALAMQAGVKASVLSATVHAYPTLAQIHRRTINTGYAGKLFSPLTRRLVWLLQRLLP